MKSWAWAAIGTLLASGAFGGAACSSSNSSGTGGSTGSGTNSGGSTGAHNPVTTGVNSGGGTGTAGGSGCPGAQISAMDPTCNTCLDTNCCAEATACDMNCQSWLSCLQAGTAQAMCDTMFATGKDTGNALNTCISSSCMTECAAANTCAGNMIAYMSADLAACNMCVDADCCAPFTQLTTDVNMTATCATAGGACPPLDDLNTCLQNGTSDPACMGDADALAAANCENTKCGNACPVTPVCMSGIAGSFTCATCEGTNCCDDFNKLDCMGMTPPADCQTNLDAFNSCTTDPTCGGNMLALAAFTCTQTSCMTECGGGAGGGGAGGGAGN